MNFTIEDKVKITHPDFSNRIFKITKVNDRTSNTDYFLGDYFLQELDPVGVPIAGWCQEKDIVSFDGMTKEIRAIRNFMVSPEGRYL